MNYRIKIYGKRLTAAMLALILAVSLFSTTVFAGQESNYHDPADHWMTANNRSNELDANAVVTKETFRCYICETERNFTVWRTPEYTRNGRSAIERNIKYSDGSSADGQNVGSIMDGTPGVDAYYTGYHWTKASCDTCGTINANLFLTDYGCGKNLYWLYDCASEFTEELPETVTYDYVDSSHHTKTTKTGTYCCFCFGTHKQENNVLELHELKTEILPQPANGRFAIVKKCTLCDYTSYRYVAAKSVIADYYGVVDGQPHTLSVTDLSESGVTTQIRYGLSADGCTLASAPNYTEQGQYAVYYEIIYAYQDSEMKENGVAYVWLRDEASSEVGSDKGCSCGCRDPQCGCQKKDCDGDCCTDKGCGENHRFILLDSTKAHCLTLGYDRYLCTECGKIEKRDYTAALGHTWQRVVVRESTCEGGGKMMELCSRCGQVKVTETAKGEHRYETHSISASCIQPGYTVSECSVCGDRHISNISSVLPHRYQAHVIPATCDHGGKTIHRCEGCNASFTTDFTEPLEHSWDKGTPVTDSACTTAGVTEYHCTRCGYHRLESTSALGHTPGDAATCTRPQTCTKCGALIALATGHQFKAEKIPATCLQMGWTELTCQTCGEVRKSEYTDALGHDYRAAVTEATCVKGGFTTFTCSRCHDSYRDLHTEALGHHWDQGEMITTPTCQGEGVRLYHCTQCEEQCLEAISANGHQAGEDATCSRPQLCTQCGAVLKKALGHSYQSKVIAPTCTEMGYTVYTCQRCGETYQSDYVQATGHKESDWIIDKEPSFEKEGSKYKKCLHCGIQLDAQPIEKLYSQGTTDSKGECIVGGYWVIVTDTDTQNPVANALVVLNKDNSIAIRLPNGRLLDYADQTTVTVKLVKDKTPVSNLLIAVTDKNNNYAADKTDKAGQVTVPGIAGNTNNDGKSTIGGEDANGNRYTITVKVEDFETGRPIQNAAVTIGKTGTIAILLPDGTELDENNRIKITVTDHRQNPLKDKNVLVKGDLGHSAGGKTDENGKLIVPAIPTVVPSKWHQAYILGYPDGSFGPHRSMTRAEAAAIFARILAEKKQDSSFIAGTSRYQDVPVNAWYAGYVNYLSSFHIVQGRGDKQFAPQEAITRAEFTAMAVRFFSIYGDGNAEIMDQYAQFTDVSSGYWAAKYIYDAAVHGWILGYEDGTFRADQLITRAEVVVLVNRLLDRNADLHYIAKNLRILNVFSDIEKSHWAYDAVMEAANAHTAILDGVETWSR